MKCKHCGAELPIDAKFCDVCGRPVERKTYKEKAKEDAYKRKHLKKRLKLIIPAALLCIALIGYKLWDLYWFKNIFFDTNYENMSTKVSAEELERLKIGMTYKEACEIIGGRGKLDAIVGYADDGFRSYIWPGELNDKAEINSHVSLMVDNSSKSIELIIEWNVKDGAEILDNITQDKESAYKQRQKIENGMSRKEVVELLGSEGILKDSRSVTDNKGVKTEKEYVWINGGHRIEVRFVNDIVDRTFDYGY